MGIVNMFGSPNNNMDINKADNTPWIIVR